MSDRAGCDVGLVGTVVPNGAGMKATIRCINLSDPNSGWTKEFSDNTERAKAVVARAVVEAITGEEEWTPPQYGDEEEPKNFGKPLNRNGDFEQGWKFWEAPDNAATFIVNGPAGRGKILRIRTDLQNDPWVAYHRRIRLGQADPTRPPRIPTDTSYASVAGNEGVHYCSEWIKAEPGARYWLVADAKGGGKIFVKGFLDWSAKADGLPESSMAALKLTPKRFARLRPEERKRIIAADAKAHPERYRRECYRWYLNCADAKDWTHLAAPFPPRGGLPANVEWLQIQIYVYWPPKDYYFDEVHLYKDPRQKAPVPEEPARTKNFERSREQTRPEQVEPPGAPR
jgi:hypothetical protein